MADNSKRRRWLQFRLRTIFVVVAVVAVPCGLYKWLAEAKQRERAAIAAIRQLGGYVRYDWEAEGKNTPAAPKWLRVILGDDWFGDVVIVKLGEAADLGSALQFAQLRSLDLTNVKVTDDDLVPLRDCAMLEMLLLGSEVVLATQKDLQTALPQLQVGHKLPQTQSRRRRKNVPYPFFVPAIQE